MRRRCPECCSFGKLAHAPVCTSDRKRGLFSAWRRCVRLRTTFESHLFCPNHTSFQPQFPLPPRSTRCVSLADVTPSQPIDLTAQRPGTWAAEPMAHMRGAASPRETATATRASERPILWPCDGGVNEPPSWAGLLVDPGSGAATFRSFFGASLWGACCNGLPSGYA